jgi:acetolactate synthase regulatory subunit
MLILDGISKVQNDQLFIPLYHRGHMSLKSKTTVTLALIPPRQRAGSPQLTEMIISPIDFSSWRSLWRIEATFFERPGIVNKLLRIVAAEGLNVLNEESSSVENRDLHTVELVVDTKSAGRTVSDIERMRALEHRILALCIEDLNCERGEPRLRVKRMKGLYSAYEKFQRSRDHKGGALQDTSFISNRRIHLPTSVMELISQRKPLRSLLVSDTKERLLRAFFLSEHDGFTYVRVAHHDSPGALDTITRELAKAFDIVNSLTRIQRQGSQNDLELLLYSSQFPRPADEASRRDIIEDLLSNIGRNLDLRVSYPESVASAEPRGIPPQPSKKRIAFREQKQMARINEKFMTQSTAVVLQNRIEEFERRLDKEASFVKGYPLQMRLKKLRELLKIEGESNPQPRVFVSYGFSRTDLSGIVSQKLRKLRCKFVTGANPDDAIGAFRDVIISRINTCDAFLGIWTKEDDGSESPWFLWELAVAQTLNLPFRLLIQEGIDPEKYLKINPEKHHRVFKDSLFQNESDIAIRRLLDDLKLKTMKEEKLRII